MQILVETRHLSSDRDRFDPDRPPGGESVTEKNIDVIQPQKPYTFLMAIPEEQAPDSNTDSGSDEELKEELRLHAIYGDMYTVMQAYFSFEETVPALETSTAMRAYVQQLEVDQVFHNHDVLERTSELPSTVNLAEVDDLLQQFKARILEESLVRPVSEAESLSEETASHSSSGTDSSATTSTQEQTDNMAQPVVSRKRKNLEASADSTMEPDKQWKVKIRKIRHI